MIKPLMSLRGVFALGVFFHHLGLFAAGGSLGVAFFFVLSGFFAARGSKGGLADKLAKFYPLHLATLAVAAAMTGVTWAIVPNLLLVQSWVPVREVFFGYNGTSWFLSDIVFMVLITPWLLKVRGRWLLAALAVYAAMLSTVPERWSGWVFYICPLTRTIDFMIGIVLYRLCGRLGRGSTLWEIVAVAVVAAAVALFAAVGRPINDAALWWLPVGLCIAVFAMQGGILSRVLSWRPLVWFGRLSFSFFLLHQLAIRAAHMIWDGMGFEIAAAGMPARVCAGMAVLVFAVGVSALSHYYFEKPVSAWIKRKLA